MIVVADPPLVRPGRRVSRWRAGRCRSMIGAAVLLAVLAGCSASSQEAVTLTVSTTVSGVAVSAAPDPSSTPPRSAPLPSSESTSSESTTTTLSSAEPTTATATASPSPTSRPSSSRSVSSTKKTAISAAISSTTGPTQASADLNVAGPDHGPACAVDPQYSDEAPTGLRADVRAAWVAVKKLARTKGVSLCLNDGKRSRSQQLALFDQYVEDFGIDAARVYVLTPQKSAHVKGYAVDVQPAAGFSWLQAGRGRYGWCRIYENEPWHFEYSPAYRAGCPARLPMPVR